jgi:hypothetical protein
MRMSDDRAYAWVYRVDLADVAIPFVRSDWWTHARRVTALYEQRRGNWDSLCKDKVGEQFSVDGAVLLLNDKGLRNGRWRYECWDTWTNTPPVTGEFTLGENAPGLPLPPLRRDVGVKLVRVGD